MKKYALIISALMLLLALSACAGKDAEKGTHVKCPACGYEFDVERYGR